jgi:hypothetical protein
MMLNDLYPSRFIKSTDLKGDVQYTISRVDVEEIGDEKTKKPVLSFSDTDKQLVLNKTNGTIVGGIYGADTDDWRGKPITLYSTRVAFGGKLVDAIRIRERAPVRRDVSAPPPARRPAAPAANTGLGGPRENWGQNSGGAPAQPAWPGDDDRPTWTDDDIGA